MLPWVTQYWGEGVCNLNSHALLQVKHSKGKGKIVVVPKHHMMTGFGSGDLNTRFSI
jgi:hypothetical protein